MPWRSVSVGTTPSKLASYNPRRVSLSVLNNGTANIFVSQDPTALDTQGFLLVPSAVMTLVREEGDEPELDLYGQAAGGTQDVRVEESVGPPVPVLVQQVEG